MNKRCTELLFQIRGSHRGGNVDVVLGLWRSEDRLNILNQINEGKSGIENFIPEELKVDYFVMKRFIICTQLHKPSFN